MKTALVLVAALMLSGTSALACEGSKGHKKTSAAKTTEQTPSKGGPTTAPTPPTTQTQGQGG